ncbi:MAG TPA: dienelactone hydrolase family protein [Nitrolancea sp.]|nr:dienelactone hydrolase family protein [Nitrolancea sp.]
MIVSIAGSSLFWLPTTKLFRQGGLAKSVSAEPSSQRAPTATALSALAETPISPVEGKIQPASIATPEPTPSATAVPSDASVLQHGMLTESNGISIGCQLGLITQYLTCMAKEPSGLSLTFYLFVPKGYTETTNYPLVLVLSGGGERAIAKNPAWLNRVGVVANPYAEVFGPGYPGQYSENVQGRWPSFIVIPQLVNPARYVDVPANQGSYTLAKQPNDSMRMTKEIVDTLQLVYHNIDANRLYVTGLSMGGYGAWEAAERWPNYWAAVAPIAGGGDPSKAGLLVNLPIWAFHSADDPVVPVSGSRDMIQAIRAAGGNPKYTEYADLGHGSWLAPYTIMGSPSPTVDFFSWLFAQHK